MQFPLRMFPAPCRLALLSRVVLCATGVFPNQATAEEPPHNLPELSPPTGLLHSSGRLEGLFRPFSTDIAALSPDGRHLAYSIRGGESLSIVVVEIDNPSVAKARVTVAQDSTSSPMLAANMREHVPARVRWMKWVTPTRIAVETNQNFAEAQGDSWVNRTGAVIAFDADGQNGRVLLTPSEVAEEGYDIEAFIAESSTRTAVWTPDQPVPSASDATSPEDEQAFTTARPTTTKRMLRGLRVVDLIAGQPESLLIRATGGKRIGVFSLNALTGKLKLLSEEVVDDGRAPLFDRQSKPRIVVPNSTRSDFPYRFYYVPEKGLLRWKPLDQLAGFNDDTGFSVSPDNFFGERSVPVGFDEKPEVLYFASNIGRDTFGIYALDMKTGTRRDFAIESPEYDLFEPNADGFASDNTLVFDRFTRQLAGVRLDRWLRSARWLRPEWQAVQHTVEKALPGHSVDLLEWDEGGTRFLILASGAGDPGAYYVFDRSTGRLSEFIRRAPWLNERDAHRTLVMSFKAPDGRPISGVLTLPRQPRMNPLPLMVVPEDEPWMRVRAGYRAEVQALAELGLVVWQPNSRGAWGFGIKHREAIKQGYEEAQVADILAAVDHLAAHLPINAKRISLLGEERGGFLALRSLQLHPERFRCAVAINPTIDLDAWLKENRWGDRVVGPELIRTYLGDEQRLKAAPLRRQPELIKKPVLVLSYPGPAGGPRTFGYLAARNFAAGVRKAGTTADFEELEEDYMRGLPKARSAVFLQIEKFVNAHLYNYNVDVGETEERKD